MKKWIAMLLILSLTLFPLGGTLAETTLGDVIGGFLDFLSSMTAPLANRFTNILV